jgi:hypothetical protein
MLLVASTACFTMPLTCSRIFYGSSAICPLVREAITPLYDNLPIFNLLGCAPLVRVLRSAAFIAGTGFPRCALAFSGAGPLSRATTLPKRAQLKERPQHVCSSGRTIMRRSGQWLGSQDLDMRIAASRWLGATWHRTLNAVCTSAPCARSTAGSRLADRSGSGSSRGAYQCTLSRLKCGV